MLLPLDWGRPQQLPQAQAGRPSIIRSTMSVARNVQICTACIPDSAAPSSVYLSLSKIMHQMRMSRPVARN